MAQALPLAKLGGLFIKTLAKPVSKRIKHEFSRAEFTSRILVYLGETSHQITSRLTIWSAGYRVRSIKPLEEEKALKAGAELIGETFILMVSGGIVIWEYNKSKEKERAKAEEKRLEARQERRALQAKLHALDVRVVALEKVVQANTQSLFNLGGEKYQPPPSDEVVPIDDDDDSIVEEAKQERTENKQAAVAAVDVERQPVIAVKRQVVTLPTDTINTERQQQQSWTKLLRWPWW